MANGLELEMEARPGKVVLEFSTEDGRFRYPLSADGAERLADQIGEAAERARDLDAGEI